MDHFCRAVRFLRNLAIVLLVLFFLGVVIHQLLPRESREKVDLVFMQTYQVFGEGWKPQGVYPRYTQYVSWDEEHREELLAAYPISEEGRELLSQSFFGEIPFNHYAQGYARPFEREVWTTVSRPQMTFHEFSHVAFGSLVVGERGSYEETYLRLQKALVESFTNPKYRDIFTVCYAKERDLSYFGMDPEHALIAILEWSGGNPALVPKPLREFAPWIEWASRFEESPIQNPIISWEQLAHRYLRVDEFGRSVLELRYGEDNPLWGCILHDLSSSEFGREVLAAPEILAAPGSDSTYSPSPIDLVFLEAEEREIRWFFAAEKEGAFAFWEKYFDYEIGSYKQDLIRRLVARHRDLVEELTTVLEYVWEYFHIEDFFSRVAGHYFSLDPLEYRRVERFDFDTAQEKGQAEVRDMSVGEVLYHLGRYKRMYGVEILDELDLGRFLEDLEEERIAPQQIAAFHLYFYSYSYASSLPREFDWIVMWRYCFVWEDDEQDLPTVLTVKYPPYLLFDGLRAITAEVEYGVPNSCY